MPPQPPPLPPKQQQQGPAYATAEQVLRPLCEHLGIVRPVRRIVLDVQLGQPVLVYCEELVGADKVASLVGSLPKAVAPAFVDRVEVSPQGGTIQVRVVGTPDCKERIYCQRLLGLMEDARQMSPADRAGLEAKIQELLFGPVSAASPRR